MGDHAIKPSSDRSPFRARSQLNAQSFTHRSNRIPKAQQSRTSPLPIVKERDRARIHEAPFAVAIDTTNPIGVDAAAVERYSSRKEVIQPHLPIRLPCYDFTPVMNPTVVSALLAVRLPTSGGIHSHGVTGGVYKARERIHRGILIHDY